MNEQSQVCTNCVMDTTDPDIEFDRDGVCNHCHAYRRRKESYPFNLDEEGKRQELERQITLIKEKGQGQPYDCIIGISGGVDSTYTVYEACRLGLRPLAVHLDNGWNSELAVHNIEKICKKLSVDLYTYIIEWEEFRDIQLSFLKASTPDSEIPTDFAITAILYKVAARQRLKYIITGDNYTTESVLPFAWSHGHYDWKYVRSVHQRFGRIPFKTFPRIGYLKMFYTIFIKGVKTVSLLDLVSYNKARAINVLQEELGWQPYKGKHHESIYTKFFQSYILPEKFGFDKRKAHLSSLILSGEITRDEALTELQKPYYDPNELREDKEYIITKLGISPEEFAQVMKFQPKTFWDYPSYENSWYYKFVRKLYRILTGKNKTREHK